MTVPVMVHGRVLCVFSLALLCVSVSATAAEQAVAVEAAEAKVETANNEKEAARVSAEKAMLAVEKANTTKVMAGVAVQNTSASIKLVKEAKKAVGEVLALAQQALKIPKVPVSNVRAEGVPAVVKSKA
ncbi:hypothetical protein DQ04_02951020 [Trypanosoma grayi]|uniref:hypothetical protein n=1 Tax=Trypanosoma grayi TaxID=71804 RepID=UPI0004F4B0C5|nr:hypothetical protein DQ04_02951020 [Trypanosoma grayi]KEG11124.1 hypothetical protein DQ04_02951020 [Trypanosoma grayi]